MIVTTTLSPEALPGLGWRLRQAGHVVRERPLLRFGDPPSWAPLDAALAPGRGHEVMALTSPRAAGAVAGRLRSSGHLLPQPVWAVGRATARPLIGAARVSLPEEASASGLARAMLAAGVRDPVLYPCGEGHREELPTMLVAAGVPVEKILCYRVELAGAESLAEALDATDLVLIASHRVLAAVMAGPRPGRLPGLVCLGKRTAASACASGWIPAAVAVLPTTDGVRDAVLRAVLGSRELASTPEQGKLGQ